MSATPFVNQPLPHILLCAETENRYATCTCALIWRSLIGNIKFGIALPSNVLGSNRLELTEEHYIRTKTVGCKDLYRIVCAPETRCVVLDDSGCHLPVRRINRFGVGIARQGRNNRDQKE